jgi:hypothetical protein
MPKTMPLKDPNDILDYTINWATWLGSDTIASSIWSVPTGLTQVTASNSTTAATIWLSGGAAGSTYIVTNQIVTAAGRTKEDSIIILGRDN